MSSFVSFPSEISAPLSQLQPETSPLWGTMTAQHVVEHLLLIVEASIGKSHIPITVVIPEEKLPRYKAVLMGEQPFPRDFKAPMLPQDSLLPLRYSDLTTAKDALHKAVEAFFHYYEENPTAIHPHPVFGYCNFEEWKWFHTKHFTHHYHQFGLLPEKT